VRTRFEGITQRARNMTRGLDEIVWAVNPANDSLASTVSYVCSRVLERSRAAGVDCHLDVATELPEIELSSDQRHNVLMAVTEAVTNVIKHSRAAEIWLRIRLRGGSLMLCVEDNGLGFEPEQATGERNGLANMRQRCEQLGGTLQIESVPGSGTKVTFLLPFKPAAGE
jgi:signal transduction histidine kinase